MGAENEKSEKNMISDICDTTLRRIEDMCHLQYLSSSNSADSENARLQYKESKSSSQSNQRRALQLSYANNLAKR